MPSLAITGSLGSGKSLLLRELTAHLLRKGFEVACYSADEENRRLLREDNEVCGEIARRLGTECLDLQGFPDRAKLRDLITRDPSARELLEKIMHPRLERVWRPQAERHQGGKSAFFVAEIPLLYERGLSGYFDRVLVIGCSEDIRRARLASHRSIPREEADRWLAMQQSQERKITLADHLLWNDGPSDSLTLQLSQLPRYLAIP
jgi:dephospho-CoA kinase